ncbi:MAG: ubiquinol-cytochrome c reductase iron-sulfur subunit, partial [Pseudomonadota bacterium]|nr:ubiquinol-cytochrome c reductase iron-sulfur subunit [Pseudomonadota bacterium]
MTNEKQVDSSRRGLLVATCAAGGVAGLAAAGALVSTFAPSERAKAAGAPVEVDIASLAPGEMKTVEWRGKPVWILKRTPEMVAALKAKKIDGELADPHSERKPDELTPTYARNEMRSIKEDVLVAVGICTHLGCSPGTKFQAGPQPSLPDDWEGGFLCPCHGSTFDLAGRVYK